MRDTDIRKQADRRFRHGELVAFAGDAVRVVEADADARAHHHAVHQRHGRLRKTLQRPVEAVLVGEGGLGTIGIASAPGDQLAHVAAGRERLRARRAENHGIQVGIARKAGNLGGDALAHGGGQRVECFDTRQLDTRQRALARDRNIALGGVIPSNLQHPETCPPVIDSFVS